MEIKQELITEIVRKVLSQQQGIATEVPLAVSARHIHLTQEHVETLFGKGYTLTKLKDLSQPGQFACNEQLTIVGPSLRPIERVRVLGPVRNETQVEVSRSDCMLLKVKAPVRASGDIKGSAGIVIVGPKGVVKIEEGCIIANRHIHMTQQDAKRFGVHDGQVVDVVAYGERKTKFYDVVIRVSDQFSLEMHIDTDDSNAVGVVCKNMVSIER